MRITRWGFLLALMLAIAPMFALQVFAVGDGVGLGPPAFDVNIQSAYETQDIDNGILVRAPDGRITQPNSGALSVGGHIGYRMSVDSIVDAALTPDSVRLWRHAHESKCRHIGSQLTAFQGKYSSTQRGAMSLPGGLSLVL